MDYVKTRLIGEFMIEDNNDQIVLTPDDQPTAEFDEVRNDLNRFDAYTQKTVNLKPRDIRRPNDQWPSVLLSLTQRRTNDPCRVCRLHELVDEFQYLHRRNLLKAGFFRIVKTNLLRFQNVVALNDFFPFAKHLAWR
jgi:hypothetical protein